MLGLFLPSPRQVCEAGRARVAQAAVSDGRHPAGLGGGGTSRRLENDRLREDLGTLIYTIVIKFCIGH